MTEDEFLAQCGWSDATKSRLAGDASGRKYMRLTKPDGSAILMDEGPGSSEKLSRFSSIARHLTSLGLSAPNILAEADDAFLLIEDLGDALFARVMANDPSLEFKLYKAAVDALIHSQKGDIPDFIAPYGPHEMVEAIGLAFDWYPTPTTKYKNEQTSEISHLFGELLSKHLREPQVLIQRDFHAENLIWLPDRIGSARAGLLDFQDAVSGHMSYDLASLLVDARRDVSRDVRREIIAYFIHKTGCDSDNFHTCFALCSAQRNLRILGIFSALCIRDGKRAYVDLIPRVWSNLMADLEHPALCALKERLTILPTPTDPVLDEIRAAHV